MSRFPNRGDQIVPVPFLLRLVIGVHADVVLDSLEELDETVWARLEIGAGLAVRVTRSHRSSARPPSWSRRGTIWPSANKMTSGRHSCSSRLRRVHRVGFPGATLPGEGTGEVTDVLQ